MICITHYQNQNAAFADRTEARHSREGYMLAVGGVLTVDTNQRSISLNQAVASKSCGRNQITQSTSFRR